jgi:hypothetical protein
MWLLYGFFKENDTLSVELRVPQLNGWKWG